MSTTTSNLGLFKYDTTNPTDLASAFNINTALNANWDKIDEAISNSGGARNIGEIVSSTLPLTDAGLHLLDGALIQGSGIYSAFVDYIAGLDLTANYFCTEAEWQQSIAQYGVCGKFVYDSVNNTVRLPKVTGILEGTTDVSALGDLVQAGLPELPQHTHTYVDYYAKFEQGHGGDYPLVSSANTSTTRTTNNASTVTGGLYGTSSTVQPQTIKAFYYIVLATSTKTDIQVDIDTIATDLNGKADTDLTNVTDSAKVLMSGMGMPSNKYVDLTLGASGTNYTAPANGWFGVFLGLLKTTSSAGSYFGLYNTTKYPMGNLYSGNPQGNATLRGNIVASKGDVIQITYANRNSSVTPVVRFYYAQGSESEAN